MAHSKVSSVQVLSHHPRRTRERPVAARLALARRLAALLNDPEAPAHTVVQAARALGTILTAMFSEAEEAEDEALQAAARRMLEAVA
jgi:hypothetical protein